MDHREGTLVISTPSCLPLSKPAPELPTDPTLSSPSSSSSSSAFFSPRASSSIPPYAHFYYILCVLLFCYFLILQNDTPFYRFGLFLFLLELFCHMEFDIGGARFLVSPLLFVEQSYGQLDTCLHGILIT